MAIGPVFVTRVTAACTLYCHNDSAYLCTSCDELIHAATPLALISTTCENVPAAFTCKADALSLCTNCDVEIELDNPLVHHNHQVPILPISSLSHGFSAIHLDKPFADEATEEIDEDETVSWLLLDPEDNDHNQANGFSYGGEAKEYLDHLQHNSCTDTEYQCNHLGDNGSDSVVPVQSMEVKDQQQQQKNIFLSLEHEASKAAFISTPSSSQCVPMSLMDDGIVPEAKISNILNSYNRPPKGAIDLFLSPPLLIMPLEFTPMTGEGKILRYKEKRKARKFEKKIRYVTRKAYAET